MKKIAVCVLMSLAGLVSADAIYNDDFSTTNGWAIALGASGVIEVTPAGVGALDTAVGQTLAFHKTPGSGGAEVVNSISRTIDTTGYKNITLDLTAFQHGGSFEGPEYLMIEIDTGSGFTTLLQDAQRWKGKNSPAADSGGPVPGMTKPTSARKITLSSEADNGSFTIRISVNVGAFGRAADYNNTSEVYYLDSLVVSGDAMN